MNIFARGRVRDATPHTVHLVQYGAAPLALGDTLHTALFALFMTRNKLG